MADPFWLVFADPGGRHATYESAVEIARQHVALNPLTTFFVMRAVASVSASGTTIEVEEIPDGDGGLPVPAA